MTCTHIPVAEALAAALHDQPRPLCDRCDADDIRQRQADEHVATVTRHEAELAAEQDRLRDRWADPAPSCTCGTARELLAGHLAGSPPDCAVHRPQRAPQPGTNFALNDTAAAAAVVGCTVTGTDL